MIYEWWINKSKLRTIYLIKVLPNNDNPRFSQAAGPVRRSSAGNLPYSRGDPGTGTVVGPLYGDGWNPAPPWMVETL